MLRLERWQILLITVVCLLALGYAWPNLLNRQSAEALPGWVPSKQISLGLDLQGGSHLLLEVDVDAVIAEYAENLVSEVRANLRAEQIGYTGLGRDGNHVVLRLRDVGDFDRANQILSDIDSNIEVSLEDDGRVTLALTEAAIEDRKRSVVTQSIEIVRRRIDETGTREPTIQRQGDDRILVQLPGIDDPERVKEILGRTAKMNFRMVDERTPIEDALRGRLPPGSELLYERADRQNQGQLVPIVIKKRIGVSGDTLTDANATYDQYNQPAISLRFDSAGARKFGDLTTQNVGQRFAIVLDGEVISAPVIREPIPGGTGQITGNFSVQEAQDLALLLRAGALPAPLNILEERTVGPSLGADSIAAGKIASIVGLGLVIVYMIASYGLFGIAATLALFFNLAMIIALLSVLQATLTLPGIAGIVLTIGMAVDANVLIFERIREEVRNGRAPFSAVDIGFQQALRTIVDANLTTLIAAVILFQFGSGPVRGFAVTLAIGIVTSMFSALMITRLLIVLWLKRTRPKQLPV